ncbi:hypothetical protein ABT324_28265 [Saccharopolyspora sp. NPDC000359]|uniref:hypothetical protein n=1 Tax=Saccharopolyspora sp. NPDC000359 TaxID=3154251 RepID=UPI0033317846
MPMISLSAVGAAPDLLFPAIPHRAGRIIATVVAAAAVITVWAPAAITDWPLASIAGATVSSALGLALLAFARVLLLRVWRQAAHADGDVEWPIIATVFITAIGVLGGGALLAGGPLFPSSALSPLAWIAVALWGAHEAAYSHREFHRAKTDSPA